MQRLHDISGPHYNDKGIPAIAGAAASALQGIVVNPFDGPAYINSISFIPVANITGDNTNTVNLNVQLEDGTEIAHLDFPTNTNAVIGTTQAFSFTLSDDATATTAAQRKLAAGKSIRIGHEKVGTSPAVVVGHVVRVEFLGA